MTIPDADATPPTPSVAAIARTSATARPRRLSPRQAAVELAGRDPVAARMLAQIGPPSFPPPTETHFATLVRSIVYQQLAGAAATAIHRRLIATLDGDVAPERVLATDPLLLRGAGLSGNKLASLLDLAGKVVDGTVLLDRRLARLSDADVVARLTTVRGIGRWSAEMFMMFQLRRLDVWPTGDLAVRRGFGVAWGIPTPSPKELELLGEPFHPYRSIIAWWCWRAASLSAEQTPQPPPRRRASPVQPPTG